jgi:hypothetical protein
MSIKLGTVTNGLRHGRRVRRGNVTHKVSLSEEGFPQIRGIRFTKTFPGGCAASRTNGMRNREITGASRKAPFCSASMTHLTAKITALRRARHRDGRRPIGQLTVPGRPNRRRGDRRHRRTKRGAAFCFEHGSIALAPGAAAELVRRGRRIVSGAVHQAAATGRSRSPEGWARYSRCARDRLLDLPPKQALRFDRRGRPSILARKCQRLSGQYSPPKA